MCVQGEGLIYVCARGGVDICVQGEGLIYVCKGRG